MQLFVTFVVSMIPLIELRGAIPIGVAINQGAPDWAVLVVATIGNLLPVPIIYWFSKKVLDWGAAQRKIKWFAKFCKFCLVKGKKAGEKLLSKVKGGAYWALYLYVALPVPGTGAWTGTLAATILNLDFKKTMFAVIAGVVTAGTLMLLASLGLFKLFVGG